MKRIAAIVLGLCLSASPALASPEYMCTVTSSGSSVNSSTVAACKFKPRSDYLVQCDQAAYVSVVSGSSDTVTSTNGMLIGVGDPYPIRNFDDRQYVAVISVSGTANCLFFRDLK